METRLRDPSYWFLLIGHAGVLIGLVLVALQLRQNTELLRLQMLNEESYRFTAIELALVGEDGAQVWQKMLNLREPGPSPRTGSTLASRRELGAERVKNPGYVCWN